MNTDSEPSRGSVRVVVVGVGGGGCNAVTRMRAGWSEGPEVYAVNTDTQSLAACGGVSRVQIGRSITHGQGAGGDGAIGKLAAEDDADVLREMVSGAGVAFIVVTLGGGTGCGAAPEIARIAREEGALTLCFAALPFEFEGQGKRRQAEAGLRALRMQADVVIGLPNDRLISQADQAEGIVESFARADRMLGVAIQAMWRLITQTGIINLDFADLRHVVEDSRDACAFGYGEGMGPGRAALAVDNLMKSPLLDRGDVISSGGALLVNVVGGPDMTLVDVQKVMNGLRAVARRDARIFPGAAVDPAWTGRLAVTVLVAEHWQPEEESAALVKRRGAVEATKEGEPAKAVQPMLTFDLADKGRFKNVEPTYYEGEDLDTPTFVRRGIKLSI